MIDSLSTTVKYYVEAVRDARELSASLRDVSTDHTICTYLTQYKPLSGSFASTLGKAFYDMNGGQKYRKNVGTTASRLLLLTSVVDDVIDERKTTYDEKCRFLDAVGSDLFGYTMHHGPTLEEEASYSLAWHLREEVLPMDREGLVEGIFSDLSGHIKNQFLITDPHESLLLSQKIGACCIDCAATVTDLYTGNNHHSIRLAARKIGEYGQILDNLHDMERDLEEGTFTYPTLRILEEGDNLSVRNDIRNVSLSLADMSFSEGLSFLRPKQRVIYQSIKHLFDLKYLGLANSFKRLFTNGKDLAASL